MPPQISATTGAVTETVTVDAVNKDQFLDLDGVARIKANAKEEAFKLQIVWRNVAIFVALHFGALVGLYQLFFVARWPTVFFTFFYALLSGLGITAGAHRLWAHNSYKAKTPLKLLLLAFQTISFQNDVIEWCRDHRCHHKWTDTDADPHNVSRGFFFSHMGWLLARKHPKLKEFGAKLDMSDLTSDKWLMFQRKYYLPLVVIFSFLLPTVIPVFFWKEKALVAFYTAGLFRYVMVLHFTWLINSVAHIFGYRPYDVSMSPRQSVWMTVVALGEGAHNYHHTFPQDYRTSELSVPFLFKLSTTRAFIDAFARIGWAYDLKTVSQESVERQKAKQVEILKQQGKLE